MYEFSHFVLQLLLVAAQKAGLAAGYWAGDRYYWKFQGTTMAIQANWHGRHF